MDKKALQLFLQENSPAAYKKYTQSKKMITAGWWMFGGGMGIFGSGMLMMFYNDTYWLGVGTLSIGCSIVLSSIITLPIGYHRQNHAYELYNYEQKKKQPQLSLGVQASENGIGLALQF